MRRLGLAGTRPGHPETAEGWASRAVLDLYGGDPIQRNLAAHALGRPEATGDEIARMAWLVDALDDEYPSVRWFAWRSLRDLAARSGHRVAGSLLARFDYLAAAEERLAAVEALRALLPAGPFVGRPEVLRFLEEHRLDREIWIGE
jgi:hypothetical protein